MRIGLFGLFGCGNSGNDASLEATILFLRRTRPDIDLLCVCPNPDVVQRDFQVAAITSSPAFQSPVTSALDRMLLHVPRRLLGVWYAFRQVRKVDVLLVPGTGFLDDFSDTPWGWPFMVLKWFMGARLCGRKIALVSIGAGPIRHPLSRLFMKTAARMASYRSYRDPNSKEFMTGLGLKTADDAVYPDVVFGLPVPAPAERLQKGSLTVGVGVMSYFGWSPAQDDGALIYRSYLRKLDSFVTWLLDQGFNVRLLTGDTGDWSAVEDLRAKLGAAKSDRAPVDERVAAVKGRTLQDLMVDINQTDFAVVTRYHNLVCSLKLGRPVISLEYSTKNRALMADVGLVEFCQHVETFDLDLLKQQFNRMLDQRVELANRISAHDTKLRNRLLVQENILLDVIDSRSPSRRRAVSAVTS